jgi:hypothetical protein
VWSATRKYTMAHMTERGLLKPDRRALLLGKLGRRVRRGVVGKVPFGNSLATHPTTPRAVVFTYSLAEGLGGSSQFGARREGAVWACERRR